MKFRRAIGPCCIATVILLTGMGQVGSQDATPSATLIPLDSTECVLGTSAATPIARNSTPVADAAYVGIFEKSPAVVVDDAPEGARLSVERLVPMVYGCVAQNDERGVDSYFSSGALASLNQQSQMPPIMLLDRFGPRDGFRVIDLGVIDDGRLLDPD